MRVTSGWTERHTAVALLLMAMSAAPFAGFTESAPVAVWVAAAALLTAGVALALDPWGGAVAGLVGAASLVGVRQLTGQWTPAQFGPAAVETLAIVIVGGLSGYVGNRLRARPGETAPREGFKPAYGSLGLLGPDAALARLEEEAARSAGFGRGLSLALLDVTVTEDLPPAGRQAVHRAVARLLESRTAEADVPFALSADRLGVIFPEASGLTAWDTVGEILQALGGATFTFGPDRTSRSLAGAADIHAGIAQLGPGRESAQALLEAAVASLDSARTDDEVPR
jgi:hypothetical protein